MNIKKIIVLLIGLTYSSNNFSVAKATIVLTTFGFIYGTYAFADNIQKDQNSKKNDTTPAVPVQIQTSYSDTAKNYFDTICYFGNCFKNEEALKNGATLAVLLGAMGLVIDSTLANK